MNSTIETTLEPAWWRTALQGISLVCGLALAAVIAFGTPNLQDASKPGRFAATPAEVTSPVYPAAGARLLYIVGSDSEKVALESALSERSLVGGIEAYIVAFDESQAPSPYQILSNEIDPSVQIIDLTAEGTT